MKSPAVARRVAFRFRLGLRSAFLLAFAVAACGDEHTGWVAAEECSQLEQSVDFAREMLDDGTLLDETLDVRCVQRTCDDRPTLFGDIVSGSLSATDEDVVEARLELVELPTMLNFNQAGLREGDSEYAWRVTMDIDTDGTDDLAMSLYHAKSGAPFRGSFLENMRHSLWNPQTFENLDADFVITRKGSTLHYVLRRDQDPLLEDIDERSVVSFKTYRSAGDWFCTDTL